MSSLDVERGRTREVVKEYGTMTALPAEEDACLRRRAYVVISRKSGTNSMACIYNTLLVEGCKEVRSLNQ